MAEKRSWKRRLVRLLLWIAAGFVLGTSGLVLVFRFVPVGVSALMIERRIEAWSAGRPYRARHRWVPLDRISPNVGLAVIAGEDQTFPENCGFDWKAIERAYIHNEHSRHKRGASTISQQTAKNVFLWDSRSWVRKGFEAWFTLLMSAEWPKRRVLETYLNSVEFGDGIYGVEAASRIYFGKPASRLTPEEAALLAAVLPNPHKFHVNAPSPYVRTRQAWILRQMRQLGGVAVVKDVEAGAR